MSFLSFLRSSPEMHAGESASVDAKGAVTRRSGPQATAHAIGFVRTIPKRIVKVLSLVDVVAGGDGFGKARDRASIPPARLRKRNSI